jgi:hypothetical protein
MISLCYQPRKPSRESSGCSSQSAQLRRRSAVWPDAIARGARPSPALTLRVGGRRRHRRGGQHESVSEGPSEDQTRSRQ